MVYSNSTGLCARMLLLLILTGTILSLSCKSAEVQTSWSATPVKIDGETDDWAKTPMVYFEDSGVQLGLGNDSEKLYILFRFNNQTWAHAIRRSGLTLWLDSSGKKKKDFGIRYTGGPSFPDMQKGEMPNRGGFWDSLTPEQQQRIKDMQTTPINQVTVIGKKGGQEKAISADGSWGPAVSFGYSKDVYTYEFSIPLQKSDVSRYGIGAEPGQSICLGLEWCGMSEGDRKQMMPEGGGGRGMPPGGGPPGGGSPGGGPPGGGRSGPGMQSSEKQEIWVKTLLSSPPVR